MDYGNWRGFKSAATREEKVISKLLLYFAISFCWLVISAPVQSQLYERYLKGSRGPYRGRVIDAETKQPLVGAVVLAIWQREIPMIVQINTEFYEAREVLTDSNGEFIIHAEDIETNAPSRTLRPVFVIFFPGYGWYPRSQVAPTGFTGGNFEGNVTLVELPKLKTKKERLEAIGGLPPFSVPDEKMPNLIKFKNVERTSLGLQPVHEPGVK